MPVPKMPLMSSFTGICLRARVNREIFTQFAEQLGSGIYGGIWVGESSSIPNIHGYRRDVVNALRDLSVPVVRWPGGC